MKKFLIGMTVACVQINCIINLSSCQELNIDSQKEFPAKMEVDAQNKYNVLATAPTNIVFNISSNTPWRITSDQNWCVATPAMSAASSLVGAITVHLENNELEESRTAVLNIGADGVDGTISVTIIQDSKGALHVQPIDDTLPTGGGTATFTVTSNKPWHVISDNQWLTFDKAEGTGTGVMEAIAATASSNAGGKRTTLVTISTGLEKKTFEVTQNGMILEFAGITDSSETLFSGTGLPETKTYTVVANVPWDAETENDWITLEKVDEEHISVKVLQSNPYFAMRKGNITLKPTSGTSVGLKAKPLTINQGTCFNEDKLGTSAITINKNGSATLASVDKNKCRFYTKESSYKLGTYIWTFSQVHFTDPAYFDINFYNEKSAPRFELFLGEAHGNTDFRNMFGSWGTGWWSQTNFNLSLDELNAMRTLKIEFIRDPANSANLKLTVWLNDRELASITKPDLYADLATNFGNEIYFGFNGFCSDAEVTIDSFEIRTIE